MIVINTTGYEVIEDYRNGFNEEAFRGRYSDILHKYDYIVGDWGYNQLRLKGFFDDKNPKATFDTKISTLTEYLYEYCNFGCAYFVVKKIKNKQDNKKKGNNNSQQVSNINSKSENDK